ncbi:RYamide receptor-like [Saccoglossus kowalevskii]|uniref:Tachykinin-like peptides receptor 99D-like n=1 Tax=Saccoglossus kowalevskii TaxID=10224 RepID=A0ABM0GKN6_SACKO|nr:PREDICTED: tachykinin-like peptides receptor 99D-like [Saccoglossus kowalevskii]
MSTILRVAAQYNFTDYLWPDNITDNSFEADQQPPMMEYYQPLWLQVILAILYACTSVLAVIGNLVVCYIVLGNPRMRTVTNYFIVNLAISDILMAVLCVNLTFYYSINFHWPFGIVMCALVMYIQMVSVSISIFTLVAISLDRYVAIIHPLRPRMTKRRAFIVIVVIWLLAGGISLPAAINSKIETYPNSSTISCSEQWATDQQRSIYTISLMIIQYFLPLLILSIAYSIIGYSIWGRKPPGERERHRDARQAESKKKLVKMFALIVFIFAICYLPIHTFILLLDHHPQIQMFHFIKVVYFAVHWTAMSNCVYNPFVYCWMNAKFRNGFRHVFRFLPCVHYTPKEKGPLRRVSTYTTHVDSFKMTLRKENSVSRYSTSHGRNSMHYY